MRVVGAASCLLRVVVMSVVGIPKKAAQMSVGKSNVDSN